jgi:MFS family permease
MFAPSVEDLMVEFKFTNSILRSSVLTVLVLRLATGSLVFAPFLEIYGRFVVHHVGYIGFFVFMIACAVPNSLIMLIRMRF